MQELLRQMWCEIVSWNWSGIIQSTSGLGTLIVAIVALTSWRRQHRSQAVIRLLDQLTDSIHDFIQSISPAVQKLTFIRIGIESKEFDKDIDKSLEHPLAVAYIENEGREAADRLMALLKDAEQPVHRIRSLLVKGQVLSIPNYHECQNACNMIVWQFDRFQAVYAMLSSQHMNWRHPEVVEQLGKVMDITPEDITRHLEENQKKYLVFLKETYAQEYKSA
jgi:phosphoglycerate-specific signal transduction histidine kinase